jgi:hypothetical protein
MGIPLEIRLLLLLVLAWRLTLISKKKNPLILPELLNFNAFHKGDIVAFDSEPDLETLKRISRRLKADTNQRTKRSLALELFLLLEKNQSKRGIYYIFWHKTDYVMAYYQYFKEISYTEPASLFEKILMFVNPQVFEKLQDNEALETAHFQVHGDTNMQVFTAFDESFSIHTAKIKTIAYLTEP